MAYDFPNAPTNGQIIETASQRYEWVAAATRWEWRGDALLNGTTGVTVPGTNTWTNANTTLTATGCVQMSTDNTNWSQNISVTTGGTFYTRWDPGATCGGAAVGTTITGTITDDTTGAVQRYSYTIAPVPWTTTPTAPTVADGVTTSTFAYGEAASNASSTGCIEFSVDGGTTWGQGPTAVTTGTNVQTRWVNVASSGTCGDAPHGTTITGTFSNDLNQSQSFSLTIDKMPDPFTFAPATSSKAPSSVTDTASFTLAGVNAKVSLWGALTTTSGGTAPSTAEYSTDNVTFTALPAAVGTAFVGPGATIYVRFVTGDTVSTTDTLTLNVGGDATNKVSGTYTVTVAKPAFSGTAPSAPTIADGVTTNDITWNSGATSIYGTGCVEFSVDGGTTFTQASTAITDGTTLKIRWKDGTGVDTTCADATHGTTITGSIESATNGQNSSLVVDRQPSAFNFTDQTNVATSTQATSNTVTIAGTNAISYLQWTPDATNPLTTVQASINGGAYVAIPAVGTYTLEVPPGATVTIQGTTGAGISTAYSGTVTMGDSVASTTDVWTVTTVAALPAVTAPTITSPTDGATNVGDYTGLTLTSSAYTPLNGAGAHNCTDWEVYKNSHPLQSTNTITGVTQNANGVWGNGGSDGLANYAAYSSTGNRIYVAGQRAGSLGGISYSDDGGTTWVTSYTGTSGVITNFYSLHAAGSTIVALGINGQILVSTNSGASWTNTTTVTMSSGRVTYDGTRWLITSGNQNRVYSATDPTTTSWTQVGVLAGSLYGVASSGSTWVVAANGNLHTSTNSGGTWTSFATTIAITAGYPSVTYANGVFIACGTDAGVTTDFIYRSTTGTAWTNVTPAGQTGNGMSQPLYLGGSSWVIVDNNGGVYISSDNGVTWTIDTSYGTTLSQAYIDGYVSGTLFAALPNSYQKANTASTTLAIAGCQTDGFKVNDIVDDCGGGAGPGTILSLDDTNVTLTSSTGFAVGENICRATSSYSLASSATCDTVNLTSYPIAKPPLEANTTYYARAQYNSIDPVASGYGAWSEFTTGTLVIGAGTWTPRTAVASQNITALGYGAGLYVKCFSNGVVYTSPDGINWTNQGTPLGVGVTGYAVTYGGGQFVLVGTSGGVATSPDGITWTLQTTTSSRDFLGVAYDGAKYVVVGGNGEIWSSPDGITWTSQTSATGQTLNGVTYGGGLYVAVGNNGAIVTSPDGVTWTSRTAAANATLILTSVAYGDGKYVYTSLSNSRAAYSTDGITWTGAALTSVDKPTGVAFGAGRWWYVGQTGTDCATSTDGINWTASTTTLSDSLRAITYGGSGFLAGGLAGAIATNNG